MNKVVDTLERELARLEAELRADPRYRRITRIKELIADYLSDGLPDLPGTQPVPLIRQAVPLRAVRDGEPRQNSKAAIIRNEIRSLLADKQRMHRSDILTHLVAKGLMGHEKSPLASLAAYLSDWKDMVAHDGQGNWFLTDPNSKVIEDAEAASSPR